MPNVSSNDSSQSWKAYSQLFFIQTSALADMKVKQEKHKFKWSIPTEIMGNVASSVDCSDQHVLHQHDHSLGYRWRWRSQLSLVRDWITHIPRCMRIMREFISQWPTPMVKEHSLWKRTCCEPSLSELFDSHIITPFFMLPSQFRGVQISSCLNAALFEGNRCV